MRLIGGALATLGILSLRVLAASDGPEISQKKFPAPPINLFYFDDSETVMVLDPKHQTVYRSDDAGEKWEPVDEIPNGQVSYIMPDPHDSSVAIAMGMYTKHWITYDRGKSWRAFETSEPATQDMSKEPFSFHATDSKRILFHGQEDCLLGGDSCVGKTYYTTNGFVDNEMSLVHGRRRHCIWAKSNVLFDTGSDATDKSRIICIVEGKFSPLTKDYKLIVSDDYFKTEQEPVMAGGREVRGFVSMAAVRGYIVAAAKSFGSRELGLYVTTNGERWHRAEFGDHRIEEDAYTILESTNYSIQVDVMTQRFSYMGSLFTSNSNGTYFTKNVDHTNRSPTGIVDFEKIQNIQGIVLVNVVNNWEEVQEPLSFAKKEIKSRISFDDGRTWEPLMVGKEELHIHSVTEQHNSGRVFSSAAPGIVMGIGNTGKFLEDYNSGSLFVSDDAGRTWIATNLKGPQKYEFLDQGSVLVAVAEKEIDEVSYSLDHGRTWKTAELPVKGVRPFELTTIPDATSLKALLVATQGDDYYTFTLDFDGLHERKCGNDDFEKWYARVDDDGNPSCIMGHKQYFTRRKRDANCFVKELTKEHLPQSEPCDCTDADFECDFNYQRTADGDCELVGKMVIPEGSCKNRDDKFKGSSGFRLIPGNDCKRVKGPQKDDLVEHPCSDGLGTPASGKIEVTFNEFRGDNFRQTFYLERDIQSNRDDETVVLLTDRNQAWITHDHGKTWELVRDEEILAIYPHQYNNDHVYFITGSRTVYYSKDRGFAINAFEAPDVPDPERQVLSFHQDDPDWLIWLGDKNCQDRNDPLCHTTAHVSQKGGDDWTTLLNYIEKCQFMYREGRRESESLIYCEQYRAEDKKNPLQLISSTDFFAHKEVVFDDVVNFATMSEFIVVAAKTEDHKWLKVDASVDGKTFAPAEFPPNFQVAHQQAYTVLDSSTNSIFLHVTVNGQENREYGTILKSNSNGTSYVVSIRHVNRNLYGYVDFEKMQGIEGVAIVNQVANADAVDHGAPKQLKTLITHNDGADWAYLPKPATDLDGKKWDCDGKGDDLCSLHLHGYTERKDPRDTYSSPSAIGVMIGVGNVGDRLGSYNEGDTFITTDGGITWKVAMKGTYMWEYGDQGSIIVLVERNTPTKTIFYTLDEGKEWKSFQFSESKMLVERITTVPSDNSRNFLLWGKADRKLTTVNLDFTGLTSEQCKLDKSNLDSEESDYYLWHPTHPLKREEPECLFGHVAQYYRKKPDRLCYNGPLIDKLHDIERNCSCTRDDFECAYNYERQPDGSCRLVEGLSPPDPMEVCRNDKNAFEYWDVTPYRKIPISTCHGGKEMEHTGSRHPCPGKEEEFAKKRGISGVGIFFAIVIPFAAASAVGYWVYKNWGGKFGAIRLGETPSRSFTDSPWVQWPVAAVSGLVAVLAALPLLVGSLWRSVRGMFGGYGGRTYTSRSSFARGRGDYAAVDNDADELLGDESDEEV
ncbi:uncharacterized protein PV09_07554 [Verruconis gallopava]|uniref:Vacuolar protein sorting/targeting protein 10 n=1 Tax=Verruconis gallopava TaxID=253628 RepID=A0A0D2API3_9PEZI|nr:uncharacterized protein PV09_07554 [Verruconis gallopava]KIW01039.1 hypothetical protein PV09_07554 [Verruconis gallopava]